MAIEIHRVEVLGTRRAYHMSKQRHPLEQRPGINQAREAVTIGMPVIEVYAPCARDEHKKTESTTWQEAEPPPIRNDPD